MLTKEKKPFQLSGTIVRCNVIAGRIHQIAVSFDQRIDVSKFVDGQSGVEFQEDQSVQLPQLTGKVLYIDDCIDSRELIQYFIEALGVKLTITRKGTDGAEIIASSTYDLVIFNLQLKDISSADLVKSLRAKNYSGPLIGVCNTDDQQILDNAKQAGCDDWLTMPYRQEDIIEILQKHLGNKTETDSSSEGKNDIEPLFSEEWSNIAMRPVILRFLDRLNKHSAELKNQLGEKNYESMVQLCSSLKNAAVGFGFPSIGEASENLLNLAEDQLELDLLNSECERLIQLCKAAYIGREKTEK